MIHNNWIAILDYGSQVTQLIARRIREQNIYCEILRFDIKLDDLIKRKPNGIILSGGPCSVTDDDAPKCDSRLFELNIPILGICYGLQLTAQTLGGVVQAGKKHEYGKATMRILKPSPLFKNIPDSIQVWMSHGDKVIKKPNDFDVIAKSDNCSLATIQNMDKMIFGVQFHPEVVHTPEGSQILRNFAVNVCKCKNDWVMEKFIEHTIQNIQETVDKENIILGLSGGVDSSVVAALIHKAVGNQLHCVYVDNGLMRFNETEEIKSLFKEAFGINLYVVNAGSIFIRNLKNVIDPEEKRKIIGSTFIDVFSQKAREISKNIKFLAQGTLYPDVIESISPIGGPSATIKSHHNVGGLPEDLKFELLEPLRELFKDEVRLVGNELNLPDYVINRQPFPGPGLAVRIIGEITHERIKILQKADLIVREEILKMDNHLDVWQYFAVLLPIQSVGVMGDDRTYEHVITVRAVESLDGMTADWYKLPYDVMDSISNRIINEVRGVNRVCYDISSKPPSTIEWE